MKNIKKPKELSRDVLILDLQHALRLLYPHGHPRFVKILLEEAQLHSDKNHDYAAGGNALGNFQRVSAIKKLYPGFPDDEPHGVALNFMLKQLDAVMWSLAKGTQLKVEGTGSRLMDIAVYAVLCRIMLEEKS